MSTKYPGGIISKTAPTPSGPYSTDTAPGVWTLEQQAYWQKLGQWPTAGNVDPSLFIENLFSTYLYTGNGSTQTITNGIDESGKGAMTWIKCRSTTYTNRIFDTTRGATKFLVTSSTAAEDTNASTLTAFSTSGFSVGASTAVNESAATYASWTFREQPKFFDIVTYTGDGTANRQISHSLGSVPGCIIVKKTNSTGSWYTYHRSLGDYATNHPYAILLDSTDAKAAYSAFKGNAPTSTTFTVDGVAGASNTSGDSYVAYLFAHDAGGFGTSGLENVISCGSYNSATAINLGYEPQWLMVKRSSDTGSWYIINNMTGFTSSAFGPRLFPNLSNAEGDDSVASVTATGFNSQLVDGAGTYIYIAIRRGPMATPTVGTSVFNPVLGLTTAPAFVSSNFNSGIDSAINFYKPGYTGYARWSSRLTGTGVIPTSSTAAESAVSVNTFDYMNGFYNLTGLGSDFGAWMFKRAPGFHDEVCYTGLNPGGATLTVNHNLSVTPELVIVRERAGYDWLVYSATTGTSNTLFLNLTNAVTAYQFLASPSASTITVGAVANNDTSTYVAYLFATCPGVSKVGSYTGTGTTAQINCGFTTGARFVMIKRTDSTGDWYVWDSARGIVAGNDPYLLLNSTAAQVTSTDYVDTYSAGFEISSTAPSAINANGGTFIFLAIA